MVIFSKTLTEILVGHTSKQPDHQQKSSHTPFISMRPVKFSSQLQRLIRTQNIFSLFWVKLALQDGNWLHWDYSNRSSRVQFAQFSFSMSSSSLHTSKVPNSVWILYGMLRYYLLIYI